MEKVKYEWKTGFYAKISAEEAANELENIKKKYGQLTAANVVVASRPKRATLHQFFEWDDKKAAENYREQQARALIRDIDIVVVSDGEEKQVRAFEVVVAEDGKEYKEITELSTNEIDQVRRNAVRELNYWRSKLSFYKCFTSAADKLDGAINDLNAN